MHNYIAMSTCLFQSLLVSIRLFNRFYIVVIVEFISALGKSLKDTKTIIFVKISIY